MPHTDLSTVLALAIKDKIVSVQGELGIADVFYGEHNMIPRSPTVEVKPGAKKRELSGVSAPGGRTLNQLGVVIEVLSAGVGRGEEVERLALDQLAQSIEAELHKDPTIGGIIIHGFVRDWTPGEVRIRRSMWRTVKMTFIGQSKTYLSPIS